MDRFEAFKDMEDRWRWRLMVGNDRVLVSSKETFDSQAEALRAAEVVKAGSAGAQVSETAGLGPKEFIAQLIRNEEARRLAVQTVEPRVRARRPRRRRTRSGSAPPRLRLVGSRRPG
jgi:uncharacterized protein YegP (UPF0339 family)